MTTLCPLRASELSDPQFTGMIWTWWEVYLGRNHVLVLGLGIVRYGSPIDVVDGDRVWKPGRVWVYNLQDIRVGMRWSLLCNGLVQNILEYSIGPKKKEFENANMTTRPRQLSLLCRNGNSA